MKVAVVILAVAIVGAFAQTTPSSGPPPFVCDSTNSFVCMFKKLGHQIKYHATKLGGKLATVGQSVLDAALGQGTQLLANAGQATLGTILGHLNEGGKIATLLEQAKERSTNGVDKLKKINENLNLGTILEHLNKEGVVGKRATLLEQAKEHFTNGVDKLKKIKENLHAAFKNAVNKLYGKIADQSALKGIDEDADKQVDGIVDEFNKDNKKGFFSMAKTIASKLKDIWAAGMSKLKEKFGKKDEARAVLGFNSLADAWNAAKGHLSNLAGSISDTFKPHMDALKSGIASLGAQAKVHAGNLVNAAKGHFNTLKDKLSGHIDTLKGHAATLGSHAVNAVNALKEAVTSIAKQALANTKDTIGDAVKTGTDAAGVITGHVAGALGGN